MSFSRVGSEDVPSGVRGSGGAPSWTCTGVGGSRPRDRRPDGRQDQSSHRPRAATEMLVRWGLVLEVRLASICLLEIMYRTLFGCVDKYIISIPEEVGLEDASSCLSSGQIWVI